MTDWMAEAACQTADPDLFFGPDGERNWDRDRREAAAKLVCAECSVTAQCLQYAEDNRLDYGVWGGMAERERARHFNRHRSNRRQPLSV